MRLIMNYYSNKARQLVREKSEWTNEDREDLILKAQKGDSLAFETFLCLNYGLFNNHVVPFLRGRTRFVQEEIEMEALYGLHKGVMAYDPAKKPATTKPESYVFTWAKAYASKFVRKLDYRSGISKPVSSFTNPEFEFDNTSLLEALRHHADVINDCTPLNTLLNAEIDAKLPALLEDMPPRTRYIFKRRFLDDDKPTLQALGTEFGISRERTRQLEAQARSTFTESVKAANLG